MIKVQHNFFKKLLAVGNAKAPIDATSGSITLTNDFCRFDFKQLQFPVRLAFAMTINKSQGQSLSVCGVLRFSRWAVIRCVFTSWETIRFVCVNVRPKNKKCSIPKSTSIKRIICGHVKRFDSVLTLDLIYLEKNNISFL